MARAINLTLLLVLVSGCAKQPERDLFAESEQLYLSLRYDDAIGLLKQHLAQHPEDAGAHFYLGTCYLNSPKNGWLGIAQGELLTALALFDRQGKVNPIPRFNDATYFELICHINLAKVYLRLVLNVMNMDANQLKIDHRTALRGLVNGLQEQYEAAKQIDPNHADVKGLRERIEEVQGFMQTLPSPSTPSTGGHPDQAVGARFAEAFRFSVT